jgi:hypothetical protein
VGTVVLYSNRLCVTCIPTISEVQGQGPRPRLEAPVWDRQRQLHGPLSHPPHRSESHKALGAIPCPRSPPLTSD